MASTSHDRWAHAEGGPDSVFPHQRWRLNQKMNARAQVYYGRRSVQLHFLASKPAKFDVDDVRHVSRPPKEKEAVHVRHVSSSREPRGASAPARPTRPTCQIRRMVHVENSNQLASSGEGLVSILHVRRVLMARVGGGWSTRRSAGSRGLNGDKRLLSTHRRVWLTCHVSGPLLM